jgi:hypothetical protein
MAKKIKRENMGKAGKPVSRNAKRKDGDNLFSRAYHRMHRAKKV